MSSQLGPRDPKRPAVVQRPRFKLEMVGVANLSGWRSRFEPAWTAASAGVVGMWSVTTRIDPDPIDAVPAKSKCILDSRAPLWEDQSASPLAARASAIRGPTSRTRESGGQVPGTRSLRPGVLLGSPRPHTGHDWKEESQ